MDVLRVLAVATAFTSTVTAILFMGAYHRWATWWRTAIGRHLMQMTGLFAYLSLTGAFMVYPGPQVWLLILRITGWAASTALLIRQLVILYLVQARDMQVPTHPDGET